MRGPITRSLLEATLAVLTVAAAAAVCAADDPLTAPAPANPPAESPSKNAAEALPAPQVQQEKPPAFVLPPPDYNMEPVPANSIFLIERPEAAHSGFFANVESSVVFVHFSNQLQGGAAPNYSVGAPATGGMPITGDIVRFPGNKFDPTVSPRIELGYRFPEGFGEVRVCYQSVATSGSDTVLVAPPGANNNLGLAAQSGTIDLNIIDLYWGTREFSLGPNWEMRTAVGLRYATAYLESNVNFLNPVTVTGNPFGTGPFTRLSQTEAMGNRYIGVNGIVEADRKFGDSGFALFARVAGSGMYGRVNQTFKETFAQAPGFTSQRVTNGVGNPFLNTQFGLSYEVPRWNYSRFLVGYQFLEWWQFGRGDNDLSFGALNIQGVFLRAEFNF